MKQTGLHSLQMQRTIIYILHDTRSEQWTSSIIPPPSYKAHPAPWVVNFRKIPPHPLIKTPLLFGTPEYVIVWSHPVRIYGDLHQSTITKVAGEQWIRWASRLTDSLPLLIPAGFSVLTGGADGAVNTLLFGDVQVCLYMSLEGVADYLYWSIFAAVLLLSVRPEIRFRFRFRPIRPFFFNPVPVPVPAENWPDRPD